MNRFKLLLLAFFILLGTTRCSDNELEPVAEVKNNENIEIQNFIWKGLNLYYLWQESVPNLADTKFKTQADLNQFLISYKDPKELFESLIYDRAKTDKWSWIVDDYIELEKSFQGIYTDNGVDFGLVALPNDDIFGFVRYIIPNSNASTKTIKRGDIFWGVNGTQLTRSNYSSLLFGNLENYTLNFGTYDSTSKTITKLSTSVNLTKTEIQENPILINKVININGKKIGYLMYNSFIRNYDKELNTAFLTFKNEGINDLILDLRYNSGGSVSSAIYLSSMITGQFTGQLFTKEHWNSKIQSYFEKENPASLVSNFVDKMTDGTSLNQLKLSRLYVITTSSSASASELVINGLRPYIPVNIVGRTTSGKYTASVTLYDSSNFLREGANPNHKWAMQPIVLQEKNKLGENAPNGFAPTIELNQEFNSNMGVLGEIDEPMLKRTLDLIINNNRYAETFRLDVLSEITNTKKELPLGDNMFIKRTIPFNKLLNQ
jgi:C-terminal processing protease CtpA/Prc